VTRAITITLLTGLLLGGLFIGSAEGAIVPPAMVPEAGVFSFSGASPKDSSVTTTTLRETMTQAEYIDSILRPHNSLLTSDMVLACARWYAPRVWRTSIWPRT